MCCLNLHRKHHSLFLSIYSADHLGHFEFKTLLSSSSVFCKSHFFLYQAIQRVLCVEAAQARVFFGTKNCCSLQILFSSHHANGRVPTSSAKIFVQETCAEYHTLAPRQDEYHHQEPQGLKDLECKKGKLSSWPPIPYVPPMDLVNTKEAPETLKIKLPDGTVFNMSIFS
jgi:hypothetical protein